MFCSGLLRTWFANGICCFDEHDGSLSFSLSLAQRRVFSFEPFGIITAVHITDWGLCWPIFWSVAAGGRVLKTPCQSRTCLLELGHWEELQQKPELVGVVVCFVSKNKKKEPKTKSTQVFRFCRGKAIALARWCTGSAVNANKSFPSSSIA